jgi:hypothetical protein
VLQKLGFVSRWIHLLMTCVRTVTYSILIQGKPYGKITPSRGLRQRDPLFSYFFNLCVERLSLLIQKAKIDWRISGLPIAHKGIRLNHLFFADDSWLFCKANIFELLCIKEVLETFEKAYGQKLNRDKNSIFFSRKTKGKLRNIFFQ